jgi:hypothetical protein
MSRQTTGYQRHPLEIAPLVFGLVFLGVVAAWGLLEIGVITAADTAWILPIVLIGAGALGVLLALTKPRRAAARRADTVQQTTAGTGVPAERPQAEPDADTAANTDTAIDTDTRERHDD